MRAAVPHPKRPTSAPIEYPAMEAAPNKRNKDSRGPAYHGWPHTALHIVEQVGKDEAAAEAAYAPGEEALRRDCVATLYME